jgi:hypothetical protein
VYKEDVVNVARLREFNPREHLQEVDGMMEDVPSGLEVAKATIPDAGWGVLTTWLTGRGRVLGTYEGELIGNLEYRRRYPEGGAEYVARVEMSGEQMYVDARDPRKSNWARFVNAPGPEERANVEVRGESGQLYVVTLRDILAGEELLWEDGGPDTGIVGGRGNSHNNKLRGVVAERQAREQKRWAGRGRVPLEVQASQQQVAIPAEDEQEAVEDYHEEPVRTVADTGSVVPKVGEFILAYHPGGWFDSQIGEILEVREAGQGGLRIWNYGVWTEEVREFWEWHYKKGYLDKRSKRVLWQKPKVATHYEAYEAWVNMPDVLCIFTPIHSRRGLLVPEKEARAALMDVRDRLRKEGHQGGDEEEEDQ